MTKKVLSLLLALLMVCSLASGMAFADDAENTRSTDIVILFTSDVHCGIDQGIGYAGLAAVRDYLVAQGKSATASRASPSAP